jgi:hypothetical protein
MIEARWLEMSIQQEASDDQVVSGPGARTGYPLRMGHDERVARWRTMIGPLQDRDVSWWAAAFLKELAAQ